MIWNSVTCRNVWHCFHINMCLSFSISTFQAYASAKFADATLRALRGEAGILQCAFVASQVCIQSSLQVLVLYILLMILLKCTLFCYAGDRTAVFRIKGAAWQEWHRRSSSVGSIEWLWTVSIYEHRRVSFICMCACICMPNHEFCRGKGCIWSMTLILTERAWWSSKENCKEALRKALPLWPLKNCNYCMQWVKGEAPCNYSVIFSFF